MHSPTTRAMVRLLSGTTPQGWIGSFGSLTTALAGRTVFSRNQKPGSARVSSRHLLISWMPRWKLWPAEKERPCRLLAPPFRRRSGPQKAREMGAMGSVLVTHGALPVRLYWSMSLRRALADNTSFVKKKSDLIQEFAQCGRANRRYLSATNHRWWAGAVSRHRSQRPRSVANGMRGSHLKQFSERVGHYRVSPSYRTDDGYRLGQWVSVQRSVKLL
jgi:Helicase associated domain